MKSDIIYLVPHTHYDAVWVFNKEDYFYINTEFILKKVVDLAKETNYKFTIEQTFLLEHIENNYPTLFSEIRDLIKKDKIEIAGGQYLLSDTMICHGEVLIREIAEGKKYILEKFGKEISVSWGADEFGFNAQLPQIFKGCGYRFFAFRRGATTRKPSEFLWEGIDGSQLICHWMPLGYRAGLDLTKLHDSYCLLKQHASTENILMPSGSGVTLPQPETCEVVNAWNQKEKAKMIISTPSEFFNALEKASPKLEIRKGEMYSGRLSQVFPDSTSSRMWIKQGAKAYENALLILERWSAIAKLLGGVDFSEQLANYWRNILFISMHDVLPGTGIDEVYEEIKGIFDSTEDTIHKSIYNCLSYLADRVKIGDMIVFNSLPWEMNDWVECSFEFKEGQIKGIRSLKSGGENFEIEILHYSQYPDNSMKEVTIGFIAKVPALGFRTFEIASGTGVESTIITRDKVFTTANFEIEIDPETAIVHVKKEGKDLFVCNELRLEEELGDLYYHKDTLGLMKSESGEGIKYGAFKAESYEVEKGHLRNIIRFKSKYYALRWPYRLTEKFKPMIFRHDFIDIEKEIIIYYDNDRIDFVTRINDRHPHSRIRVQFDTPNKSGHYWCGTQFGAIRRKSDLFYKRDAKGWIEKPSGVFPSFEWIDCSDNKNGISILHRGTPSHEVRDGKLYMTLSRSIMLLSSDGVMGPCIPTPNANETGMQTFRYSVLPHEKSWKESETYKRASEINMPLVAVQIKENNSEKKLEELYSFLEIKPKNIVLSTLKFGDDSKTIVVRIYETEGRKTIAKLRFTKQVTKVYHLDLLENELDLGIDVGRENLEIEIAAFKIITLKIQF
ncbi:MAG: glycoside hydrolase [Nitrososphaeraceae archaeon]|nr:glycoside hydrolase [Nitrososphaeraceae archaeon]